MVDFFVKIYLILPKIPERCGLLYVSRGVRGTLRICINWALALWFFCTRPFMSPGIDKNATFIVSLTSFPARINTVSLCIETLLRQKKKPRVVVLWLSEEQFPSKASLPKSLLRQESRGLRIEFRKGDIRSHKKYFYAFREYRRLHVITVDDDVLYSSRLTQELSAASESNPGQIIGNQVKRILVKDGVITQYLDWPTIQSSNGRAVNIPVGVGGVFYPANVLCEDFLRIERFMKLAPQADDLWLGIGAMLSSAAVVPSGKKELEQIPLTIFSNQTLFSSNGLGGNDIQMDGILDWVKDALGRDLRQEIVVKNAREVSL